MALIGPDLSRRAALGGLGLLLPLPAFAESASARLKALEAKSGARVGLAAIDSGNGNALLYREGERFLFCSTVKFLLVAAMLAKVDAGLESLARAVPYRRQDVLDNSPVTRKHTSLAIAALCQAAITVSDNTAANLLVAALGGTDAVNDWLRGLGDASTRLDRAEPGLNHADGLLDTTTPVAMMADMKDILLGSVLAADSRRLLMAWMAASTTGLSRLRAGFASGWKVGDKTGSGAGRESNDIAIVTPPGRKPLLIAAFTVGGGETLLADVGRIAADAFA